MSNYIIDFDKLTIASERSNGPKPILGVIRLGALGVDGQTIPHARYQNLDGRYWAVRITNAEYIALEMALVEAPYTASELGLGKGLLL